MVIALFFNGFQNATGLYQMIGFYLDLQLRTNRSLSGLHSETFEKKMLSFCPQLYKLFV